MMELVRCVTKLPGCAVVQLADKRYVGVVGELPFEEGGKGHLWLTTYASHLKEADARRDLMLTMDALQQAGTPAVCTEQPK